MLTLFVISSVFFAYPVWRLADWLGLPAGLGIGLTVLAFSSQFIARIALRKRHGSAVRWVRQCADLLLGISPILLGCVVLGEVALLFGAPSFVLGVGTLLVVLCALLLGMYKAWQPQVIDVDLSSGRVSRPVVFAQISDVHIGSRSRYFLDRVMRQVEQLDAEFLCITGDFIDQTGVTEDELAPLKRFAKPIFFCTGNHEFYEDFDAILMRLKSLGVRVLRGESHLLGELQIIGVDDHSDSRYLAEVLPRVGVSEAHYSVLLCHRPHGIEHAAHHGVDLKLSGHTHDGQIKPFHWLVRMQFPYLRGLYEHEGAHLYVNQGTGTWGPTMRLGTACEVTRFRVNPAR